MVFEDYRESELALDRKILRGAILESIILDIIDEASVDGIHGYAILKEVKKKFGVYLGPSSIYNELRRLKKQGLITSSWGFSLGKPRKKYQITKKGETLLREYFFELRTFIPALTTRKALTCA